MSFQFQGFEYGTLAQIKSAGYSGVTGGTDTSTIEATNRHLDSNSLGGAYALRLDTSSGGIEWRVPVQSSQRQHHTFYQFHSGATSTTNGIKVNFYLSGAVQATVFFRGDGRVEIRRGASTVLATSASAVVLSLGHIITIDMVAANSGSCTVKVDGVVFVTFTGDTQQLASSGYDQWGHEVTATSGASAQQLWLDDMGWADAAFGEIPEFWVPAPCLPNADGTISGFTPSTGTDNFAVLDEEPPSESDYTEAVTVGATAELNFTALPISPTSILGLCVSQVGARDGGIAGFQARINSGGTIANGATKVPGASGVYGMMDTYFTTDPDTTAAWLEADVNALLAGPETV